MSSVTQLRPSDVHAQAVDIDLQCALALARTALKALVLISDDASMAVDRCIGEELNLLTMDPLRQPDLTACLLLEMRALLRRRRHEFERARLLEEQIGADAMRAMAICAPGD